MGTPVKDSRWWSRDRAAHGTIVGSEAAPAPRLRRARFTRVLALQPAARLRQRLLRAGSGWACSSAARGRLRRLIAVPLIAGAVGACGGDALRADSTFGQFVRGTTQPATSLDPEDFRAPLSCPRVRILPDTETIRVAPNGAGGAEGELRWLARIDETARECRATETGAIARVGIAGRALAGPKGPPGVVRLPIRVVVREGEAVTYSQLHRIEVDLSSVAGQDFAFVDDAVPIADRERAQILVGFDDAGR